MLLTDAEFDNLRGLVRSSKGLGDGWVTTQMKKALNTIEVEKKKRELAERALLSSQSEITGLREECDSLRAELLIIQTPKVAEALGIGEDDITAEEEKAMIMTGAFSEPPQVRPWWHRLLWFWR